MEQLKTERIYPLRLADEAVERQWQR